jgi:hypothetical protein
MESMRSTWTDSRLDEFAKWTDMRFDELKDDLSARFGDLSAQVAEQSGRIDRLQHVILVVGGGLVVAFVGVLAAIIGLIATQV